METMSREMQQVLDNIPEEMDKMLRQPQRRYIKNARAMLRTPADIYEHPSHYSFLLDMPGLEVNHIKVKVQDGILHVAGKKTKKQMLEMTVPVGVKPIRIERRRARYLRKFTLPADANGDDVKATYRNGVLTIDVAKKQQQENPSTTTTTPPPKSNTIRVPIA